MKAKTKLLILTVMLVLGLSLWAVTSRFYDSKQLSSTLVTSIVQDGRGYIWMATEYGLNKYDGVRYTQYFHEDDDTTSLASNNVKRLFVDKEGRLWLAVSASVQLYSPQGNGFSTVNFIPADDDISPRDFFQDKDGKLYVLTSLCGLYQIDIQKMQATPVSSISKYLKGDEAYDVLKDNQNRIWVRAKNQVYLFGKHVKTFFANATDFGDKICCLSMEKGKMYAFSHNHVFVFDEASQHFHTCFDLHVGMSPIFTYKNQKGEVILTVDKKGIYKVDFQSKSVQEIKYTQESSIDLSQSQISAFLEDNAHQTWIGCLQKGVYSLRRDDYPFHYMPLSNDEGVGCLFSDSQGKFYVGKGYDGLQAMGKEGLEGRIMLSGSKVLSVCEITPDKWWVGVRDGGAYIVNPKSGVQKKVGLTNFGRVKDIVQDQQGNVYVVMFMNNVKKLTADGTQELPMCNGRFQLSNKFVNTLFADSKNRIWMGSYYGFDVYDATHDRQLNIPMDSTLRKATIYSFDESKDGTIWMATNAGLYAYHPHDSSFKRYTTEDGLPNNNVCKVVDTHDGNLWVSTYRGLGRLQMASGKWQCYYNGNGLQYANYQRGVGCRSKTGEVCFANDNGFVSFMPKNVVNKNFVKGIILTGVLLKDKQVSARDKSGGSYIMGDAVEDAKSLTFSYDDNTFTLQFSTMDYRDLENVVYEYRFTDEKKGVWHASQQGNSSLTFTHLTWGKHVLQVRAKDSGAISQVKKITIHILPPWYASWWAYLLYILVIAALGYLLWRNYMDKQEVINKENKIRLFVDLSHEFRSPLTLIKSPLDTMLKRNYDAETMRGLNNIKRNTDRLLGLVNQILSIRKIEKGQMKLHFAQVDMVTFVEDILANFEYAAEKKGITLKFVHTEDVVMTWLDCAQFDKVVNNLVSNAFKYVEKDGEICVSLHTETLRSQRQYAVLKVRDTGPGIDEAQINQIFERFFQTSSNSHGQLGFGIGLNLTRQLVKLHRGKIEVHNRQDTHGAEFAVFLPMDTEGLPESSRVDAAYFQEDAKVAVSEKQELLEETAEPVAKRKTNHKVVVVDDDEQMLKFLQEELSYIYHVKAFNNGAEALEYVTREPCDLVVTDVKMPEMDGFTLLKRIKSNTKTSHIPVVLLTSEVEHKSRMTGFEQGADAYVDKPFDMDELEARVASLIANRLRVKGKFSGVQEQKGVIEDIQMKGNNEQLMERIMSVTKERLTDPDFNVEALASDVGISRVQLHRKVKELMGITVGDFIRNLRLQQAARLLQQGDLNISQITYAVGLANPTHFSAAFKRYFGVSPKQYMMNSVQSETADQLQNEENTGEIS